MIFFLCREGKQLDGTVLLELIKEDPEVFLEIWQMDV
jgi:hypothetical protein